MPNIVVPQLGESIVEARVARWLKKQGDRVEAGDPVVELETEKVDLEVRAEQAGVLSRIDRKEGEDVKVGEVLAVIDEAGAATSSPTPDAKTPPAEPPASPEPRRQRRPACTRPKGCRAARSAERRPACTSPEGCPPPAANRSGQSIQ